MARSPKIALVAALGCALTAAGLWLLLMIIPAAAQLDLRISYGFTGLESRFGRELDLLTDAVDPGPFLLLTAALVCFTLARKRPRTALVVFVVLIAANATTQILKAIQFMNQTGETHSSGFSWPSGHTTAAMSLALCFVIVCPPRLRPLAGALGGLLAVAVVYSILVQGWHLPSDVMGGFLVAGSWTFLGVAALLLWDRRFAPGAGRTAARTLTHAMAPSIFAVAVLLLGLLTVAMLKFDSVADYMQNHKTFMAGAVIIGVTGMSLVSGLAVSLRTQS